MCICCAKPENGAKHKFTVLYQTQLPHLATNSSDKTVKINHGFSNLSSSFLCPKLLAYTKIEDRFIWNISSKPQSHTKFSITDIPFGPEDTELHTTPTSIIMAPL